MVEGENEAHLALERTEVFKDVGLCRCELLGELGELEGGQSVRTVGTEGSGRVVPGPSYQPLGRIQPAPGIQARQPDSCRKEGKREAQRSCQGEKNWGQSDSRAEVSPTEFSKICDAFGEKEEETLARAPQDHQPAAVRTAD